MQRLRNRGVFLLDLFLRFPDMQPMHGGKFLGDELQRCAVAVPGLRSFQVLLTTVGAGFLSAVFVFRQAPFIVHLMTEEPQVRPAPKLTISTLSIFLMRPSR